MDNNDFIEVSMFRNSLAVQILFDTYIGNEGFICGGFARVCCSPTIQPIPTDDIDIYCYSKESFEIIKKRLDQDNKYNEDRQSPIAITYKPSHPIDLTIQLIKPMIEGNTITVGSVTSVLNNFDFTIARCGVYMEDNQLKAVADIDFEKDEMNRILNIKYIKCPISAIYRIAKYTNKGYFCPTLQSVKVLENWVERDYGYKARLIEFLENEDMTKEDIDELESMLHID